MTQLAYQTLKSEIFQIQNGNKPAFQKVLIIILTNKTANIILTKLAPVFLFCKSRRFKTANIKILCTLYKHSIYIYYRPLPGISVVAGLCAYNVWIKF